MKTMLKLEKTRNALLGGIMAVLCCSIGNAQIVYSNAFNGVSVNIQGTQPNVANDFAGGSSTATWNDALGSNDAGVLNANGSNTSTSPTSWTLPFTPQQGYVYDLTATLTFTGNPGTWVGLGFAQRNSVNVPLGYGRFSDSGNGGPNGYDWLILTEGSGNVQFFLGPKGSGQLISQNGFFTAGTGTHTVDVQLDTSSSLWSIASYVDGVQVATGSYGANPTIGAVGITQNAVSAPANYQWSDLMLAAKAVPEPSAPALIGAGLVLMLLGTLYRNRRDRVGKAVR